MKLQLLLNISVALLITVSIVLFPVKTKAQINFLDTITSSFHHKPKFLVDIGSYNSIVNGQPAIFTEVAFGVSFNKRLYFSAGLSELNTEVISPLIIPTSGGSYPVNAKLNMTLFIASAEYLFWRGYPWIFSIIPFKIGIGNAYYEYISEPDKHKLRANEQTMVTYQPQFYSSYNVLTWIGFSGSLGYRFTPFASSQIHKDLDSFTYSVGIKLFLDPIYDAIFPHGIFKKKSKG